MMRAIVGHVAALTEAAQVAQPVVGRTAGVGTADVDHHVIVLRRELPDLGSLALRVLVVGHVRLLPPSETDHGAKQHNVGWRREDHENVQGIPGNNVGDGFVWAGWRAS